MFCSTGARRSIVLTVTALLVFTTFAPSLDASEATGATEPTASAADSMGYAVEAPGDTLGIAAVEPAPGDSSSVAQVPVLPDSTDVRVATAADSLLPGSPEARAPTAADSLLPDSPEARAATAADSLLPDSPEARAATAADSLLPDSPEARAATVPDSAAAFPHSVPPRAPSAVGFRPRPSDPAFWRPWTTFGPRSEVGLRPPSAAPPTSAPGRGTPFQRNTRVDLSSGLLAIETRSGDHLTYWSYVGDLDAFRKHAGWASVRADWGTSTLAELGRQETTGGGLLDIDIPMPLPGPFVRAIGPGANLKVRGSERITFGGQTSYVVDALEQESGPASRFPQLDMEQQLTVNLEGTIGRKIHVYVDHRSSGDTFGGGKANQIRVRYEGDEDEVIQRIELGEVNLSLPGTEFVSYSGSHEGLFGAKMTSKIGKLDLITIASKEEGKSAGASFSGGSESSSLIIEDVNCERNTFYAPDSQILKTTEEFSTLKVYIDDLNGTNNAETGAVAGRAFLNAPSDTNSPDGVYETGMFDELVELEDYVRVKSESGISLGFIEFLTPVADNSVVGVSYTTTAGRTVGGVGDDGKLRLKIIKQDVGAGEDWARVRDHELKNMYDLGAEDIPEEGFELTIKKRSSSGEDEEVNDDGVPYLQVMGLDNEDQSGNQTPDNIVDDGFVDFARGYLMFPHYTPFCPAYDESTNFYYNPGSSAYTDYATGLDPKNCLIYSEESFDASDDIYYIEVNYDRPKTTFYLGNINIIENSEVVRVNGVRLTRGTDYTIYYPAGQLTLLSEEAKDPDARVTVDYDYKPFGIGGEKTLLGTRAVYNWSENIQLGTTWMYQSKGSPDDSPRLGEEPSRNIVGDVNVVADFEPELMTTIADAVPLVDTDASSYLKLSGEAAVSIPEPNTKGFVSIDDMEGTDNVSMLGLTRRLWVPSSVPVDEFGDALVDASDRQYMSWYNPDRLVRKGQLFPNLPEQEQDDIQTVLALTDYHAGDTWGGGNWAGLMRLMSKTGNDYSDYQFFEFWVNAGSSPQGVVHVDLGTISEDFYPLREPNGELDTEDYDNPPDGFDADEDTGLDNCCSTGECESQVPGCVDDAPPIAPSDDYAYDYQNSADDYRKINGTENNDRLDTEDLDGDAGLDLDNRYWSLTIDLADDEYLVTRNDTLSDAGKRTNWRRYRIPLEHAVSVGGIANWEFIKSARVWFEDLEIAGEVGEDPGVMFGSLDIIGSQWEPQAIRDENGQPVPEAELLGESFRVTAKNTKEDLDYVAPFDPGVDEETGIEKREQSLALLFENLGGGHEAAARKPLYQDEDYTKYGALEFYVYGGPETEENTEFFIRLGADSLNYYEYGLELRSDIPESDPGEGWHQDRTSANNRLKIDFSSFTVLNLDDYKDADTVIVWGDTTRIKGERFARIGWPSLSKVRQLTVGVRNGDRTGLADVITGELWVDDIRLTDVRKDIGWAKRATVDAKFADLTTLRFDMRQVDGDFHTLKQTEGSGRDNLSYNLSGTLNADQFATGLGIAAPITFSWKKTTTKPQFEEGKDIPLSAEQSAEQKSESLDTSIAASLSRKRQSPGFWTHLLVDGLSLRASVAESKSLTPDGADTSKTVRGRLAYKYNPTRQGIRLFRDSRLFLKPTSVRFSLDGYVRHSLSYDISDDDVKTKRSDNYDRKLNGEGHVDFQFLENLKTSHSVNFARDLNQFNHQLFGRNIGAETERRYNNSLTFNARFGKWFSPQYTFSSSFTDDKDPVRRFSGKSNHEVRTSFELKKLIGVGESESSSSRSSGRERDRRREDRERPHSPEEGSVGEPDAASSDGEPPGQRAGDGEETAASEDPREEEGPEGGAPEEAEEAEQGPGLSVLVDPVLTFLRKMDAIDVQYALNRTWQHNQTVRSDVLEGWVYRAGLAVDYGGDSWSEKHKISLGSGIRLTNDVRIKGDYDRTTTSNLTRSRDQETYEFTGVPVETESMNETTKGSLSWSGVEKIGALSSLFRSARARSGVQYDRSHKGSGGEIDSRKKGFSMRPVLSLDTTFKNGVSTSFTWDKTTSRTFNLTGTGSVTQEDGGSMSMSVNYRFSAPQGLKLPFFGQKLRFESNLDTSLTLRMSASETRTAATEEGLQIAEPTSATRELSLTADATYSFSRNVSGGLQFSFSQTKDEKKDQTRRTIGLHLTAEFKF